MKFFNKIKGFTLAEVMITLMVIGIISAIAIPVALHLKPDENLIKFKKAHETLHQVINTLITSDKYYLAGDLGIKADGTPLKSANGLRQYFCQSIADNLTTKSVNCIDSYYYIEYCYMLSSNEEIGGFNIDDATATTFNRQVTSETIAATKTKFDDVCKKAAPKMGEEIVLSDNTVFYNACSGCGFASTDIQPNDTNGLEQAIHIRWFSPPNKFPANIADENGFDIAYRVYCIDVDGIPDNATEDDCVNECPFGYGIRADGRILPGARAEEWLKKDASGKKEDEES